MLRFAMDESIVPTSLDILDYGGGGGQFALVAKSNYPESTIYYTDRCEDAMLEQWKGVNNQIPFDAFAGDEHTFDVIFLNDVFEHVADPVGVLSQCASKLKPAGRIFIDTPKQFWLYPATRLVSPGLYRKLLAGTVSAAHLQIWSRRAFALAVEKADLSVVKYSEVSEYTMPAHFYLKSMGITNPALVAMGGLFYRFARYLANNKIICVLKRAGN